jgi:hypothetical protein
MPKVKQVTAAKDYPQYGIVKGQKHYRWVLKTGPRSSREYRQLAAPKPQQLTTSEFRIGIYDIQDMISAATCADDVEGIAEACRSLAETQREKYDNMPENFQQGDTGQTLESQADTLETAADEFDAIKEEWESAEDDFNIEQADYDQYQSDLEEWDEESGEPEPEEVEEPTDPKEEYLAKLGDVQLEP